MKLQHNLGGLENLETPPTLETRVFVEPWEQGIFGIHVAMMALSKHLDLDESVQTTFNDEWTWADLRKGAEAMNPFDYFRFRYYEKWLGGISGFFVDKGYVTAEELDRETAKFLGDPDAKIGKSGDPSVDAQVVNYLVTGDSPLRKVDTAPKFAVGDLVRVKDVPPSDHTRLPGHLRSKTGVIDLVYPGAYTYFCSTGEDGLGEPMASYCVKFDADELWEDSTTEDGMYFYADIFETYLEAK